MVCCRTVKKEQKKKTHISLPKPTGIESITEVSKKSIVILKKLESFMIKVGESVDRRTNGELLKYTLIGRRKKAFGANKPVCHNQNSRNSKHLE